MVSLLLYNLCLVPLQATGAFTNFLPDTFGRGIDALGSQC